MVRRIFDTHQVGLPKKFTTFNFMLISCLSCFFFVVNGFKFRLLDESFRPEWQKTQKDHQATSSGCRRIGTTTNFQGMSYSTKQQRRAYLDLSFGKNHRAKYVFRMAKMRTSHERSFISERVRIKVTRKSHTLKNYFRTLNGFVIFCKAKWWVINHFPSVGKKVP